jgi:hypothetical protein
MNVIRNFHDPSRTVQDSIINIYKSLFKVCAFLSDFNQKLSLQHILVQTSKIKFHKIPSVTAETMFHEDRQTG